MPCGENSRGIGPAELAQAIHQGRPNRDTTVDNTDVAKFIIAALTK